MKCGDIVYLYNRKCIVSKGLFGYSLTDEKTHNSLILRIKTFRLLSIYSFWDIVKDLQFKEPYRLYTIFPEFKEIEDLDYFINYLNSKFFKLFDKLPFVDINKVLKYYEN